MREVLALFEQHYLFILSMIETYFCPASVTRCHGSLVSKTPVIDLLPKGEVEESPEWTHGAAAEIA